MTRVWLGALVLLTACASVVDTANRYSTDGLHELAVPYYVANYMANPKDRQAKKLLRRETDLTFRMLDMDYRGNMEKGRYRQAAGIALRKEDLALSMQGISIPDSRISDAGEDFRNALAAWAREAVKKVDEASVNQVSVKERLRLLRVARGLNPDSEEIDSRYRRLRGLAMRYVRIRCGSQTANSRLCLFLTGKIADAITSVNREFVTLASDPSDPRVNTDIDIRITKVKTGDTHWNRIRKGNVKAHVRRLNRFREPVLDREGRPVYDTVRASYVIYRRRTSAIVVVRVRVRTLGSGGRTLYAQAGVGRKESTASFYRWQGDERAINAAPGIRRLGTSEEPPLPVSELMSMAVRDAVEDMLGDVVRVLEYR